jgi:6-phosphogluconolactonase
MINYEWNPFATADELARAVARRWLDQIEAANRAEKNHCVALSGGRITQKFFASVVGQNQARKISFGRVHFFWADERCLPPTDAESNFKLADDLLFRPLNIAAENIHRLRGELPPGEAVQIANAEIVRTIPAGPGDLPALDLVFLGLGEDGHVASLFPAAAAENSQVSVPFFAVENSPKPPSRRISLSYRLIFAAKNTWVLASGSGKVDALRESLKPDGRTPLAAIIRRCPVKIFSDISVFDL